MKGLGDLDEFEDAFPEIVETPRLLAEDCDVCGRPPPNPGCAACADGVLRDPPMKILKRLRLAWKIIRTGRLVYW